MLITRIQVEEGFLDGLDLHLTRGLNVLIGPRGTGKTSIIELVRFCLGAGTLTNRAAERAHEHAVAILGSGQVTVTVHVGGQEYVFSRTVEGVGPGSASISVPATVLSQNEIEWLGLDALGRLRLIDAFRSHLPERRAEAAALRSEVRSLTVDARSLWQEVEALREEHKGLADESEKLSALESDQKRHLAALKEAEPKQRELDHLGRRVARLSVQTGVFQRADVEIRRFSDRLRELASGYPRIEAWPDAAGGEDLLISVRNITSRSFTSLEGILRDLDDARQLISSMQGTTASERADADSRARALRSQLETLQQGSGAIARRISELQERAGQAAALSGVIEQVLQRRGEVIAKRDQLLDRLDALYQIEYGERAQIAERLNQDLGPRIDVRVEHSGLPTSYVEALRNALRGSGIRYNQLAPQIAERISPRELAQCVENQDAAGLSSLVGINQERAARVISEISTAGVEAIVTCELQDTVVLSLLDGSDYKDTEHLSTGQRCTVVLPILLDQRGDLLVIDQPEDHLDNAFIVETVVEAIRRRSEQGQLLISTHNPNVPVLGEADNVILMGSDGRRGFIRHAGPLDAPDSIVAITTVMEGGLDAFRRRSAFYEAEGSGR